MSERTIPFPGGWGNYALKDGFADGFTEISFPAPVSWMPATPAAWAVVALITLLIIYLIYRRIRFLVIHRERRTFLKTLTKTPAATSVNLIPAKLKSIVSNLSPNESVASLYGGEWLEYLNSLSTEEYFDANSIETYSNICYQPSTHWPSEQAIEHLTNCTINWLTKYRGTRK